MDNETIRKIRGKSADYQRSLENIRLLIQRRRELNSFHPRIGVSMIPHPDNAAQWMDFNHFFNEMGGIDNVNVGMFSRFNNSIPEINEIHRRLSEFYVELREDDKKRRETLACYRCYLPWHSVNILWDGRVVSCCRDYNGIYVLGDLKKDSLKKIWNGKPARALRKELASGNVKNSLCAPCKEANWELLGLGRNFPWFETNKHKLKTTGENDSE